jgi:hypothetical protein
MSAETVWRWHRGICVKKEKNWGLRLTIGRGSVKATDDFDMNIFKEQMGGKTDCTVGSRGWSMSCLCSASLALSIIYL